VLDWIHWKGKGAGIQELPWTLCHSIAFSNVAASSYGVDVGVVKHCETHIKTTPRDTAAKMVRVKGHLRRLLRTLVCQEGANGEFRNNKGWRSGWISYLYHWTAYVFCIIYLCIVYIIYILFYFIFLKVDNLFFSTFLINYKYCT